MLEPRADQGGRVRRHKGAADWFRQNRCFDLDFQNWGEGGDVVVPENGFDFGEVGFGEIGAGIGWAEIDAADFQRERIGFRSYY